MLAAMEGTKGKGTKTYPIAEASGGSAAFSAMLAAAPPTAPQSSDAGKTHNDDLEEKTLAGHQSPELLALVRDLRTQNEVRAADARRGRRARPRNR